MTTSSEDRKRAAREAARWLVALEEEPDDGAIRAAFEAWLNASPVNAAAWANTSDIYDLMAKTPPAHQDHWAPYVAERKRAAAATPVDAELPPVATVCAGTGRKPVPRRVVFSVAAAAMAACLALVMVPSVLLRIEADYLTSTAELQTLNLPDGTTVRLGPDSALAVNFDERERRVRLVKGEAFFEVTPDREHPFRVATREVTTTVLGTAFDVRLSEDGAAVAVRHGQVSVDYPAAHPPVSERLEAGDWMRVGWTGDVRRGETPPDEVGAWMQGQLVVRDRPLESVVDDLRRYYAGMIVLTDGAFGEQRVSGVYNVADPVAALSAMAGAHGGAVHRISPWVLVVTGG